MSNQVKEVVRVLNDEFDHFEADNLASKNCRFKKMSGTTSHRTGSREWFDAPYISTTKDGLTLTQNDFQEVTGMAIPHDVNVHTSVPMKFTASDTLDNGEIQRKIKSAYQALEARVNRAIANAVWTQGSQFVKRTTAISGFDDLSAVDTLIGQQDVPSESKRTMIMNYRDANQAAANLAARQTIQPGITQSAYEKAKINEIGTMDIFKSSFTPSQAGGAAITATVNGAQSYTPQGATFDADGNPTNVDNRSMTLTVSSSAGITAGDKITIAGVNAVSFINKNDTGELRTFTVKSVPNGTSLEISPAIIVANAAATTAGQAQTDYANCSAVAANGAAITRLNTTASPTNLFWVNDGVCVNTAPVTGDENDLGGMILMSNTLANGMNVVVAKEGSILDFSTNWRLTTHFGVTVVPEWCGSMAGGQA